MKKLLTIVSFCLAVVMALPLVASCTAGEMPFIDVKTGKWYYGNVKYVFENGIMNGVTETKFAPQGTLTRGMCATIIHRMAGSPKTEAENKFDDVKAGKYYTKAVAWAQEAGIVNGKTSTMFDPDGAITRAEFATMMWKYVYAMDLDLKETRESDPSDFVKTPKYAREAVTMMYRSGVVNGRGNGEFDPDAPITRAEVAAMIERFNNTAVPFVREDDGVLDVAFFGDSFTYVPRMYDHLEALAEGKHTIKTYNYTQGGWTVYDHYTLWKEQAKMPNVKKEIRKWDVVILNENGLGFTLFTEEEKRLLYEDIKDIAPDVYGSSFEEFQQNFKEGSNTYKYYILLTELFGKDKTYYNLCESTLQKTEEGEELSGNGFWKVIRGGNSTKPSNKYYYMTLDWIKNNTVVNRVTLNLQDSFDPDVVLDPRDFDYLPEDYHPNLMYGYCFALALYCTMFDEPCNEQNDGIMTTHDYEIPGDTPEEKAEYMVMIKNLVQEELDFQNAH